MKSDNVILLLLSLELITNIRRTIFKKTKRKNTTTQNKVKLFKYNLHRIDYKKLVYGSDDSDHEVFI